MGFSTQAASTHSICLYSSSPKSAIAFAFLSQGFQTTAAADNYDYEQYMQLCFAMPCQYIETCNDLYSLGTKILQLESLSSELDMASNIKHNLSFFFFFFNCVTNDDPFPPMNGLLFAETLTRGQHKKNI